ncbi:MAG: hypothetical protein WC480_03825 [Patescibacteria group bacterium]
MEKKVNKFIYWTPRIMSILFIIFLTLFSLDVFEGHYGFGGTVVALLIHNIPAVILAIVLWLAWKREIVGGIIFILAGFLYLGLILRNPEFEWYLLSYSFIIAVPTFFIGTLFLVGWLKKR